MFLQKLLKQLYELKYNLKYSDTKTLYGQRNLMVAKINKPLNWESFFTTLQTSNASSQLSTQIQEFNEDSVSLTLFHNISRKLLTPLQEI